MAVHDAARPLIVSKWVDAVFAAAERTGAAIPGLPIDSTVKRVSGETTTETVAREGLWTAQTPQVFRRELLLDAYAGWQGECATDESQMVEQSGHPVTLVKGWPMNIKITTHADFKMAESLVGALPKDERGRSLHPFADDRFL